MDVPPKSISGRSENRRSVPAGRLGGNGHYRLSRAAFKPVHATRDWGIFFSDLALSAQATESQTDGINSTLTVESHTQRDNSISTSNRFSTAGRKDISNPTGISKRRR